METTEADGTVIREPVDDSLGRIEHVAFSYYSNDNHSSERLMCQLTSFKDQYDKLENNDSKTPLQMEKVRLITLLMTQYKFPYLITILKFTNSIQSSLAAALSSPFDWLNQPNTTKEN